MTDRLLAVLRNIRIPPISEEYELQNLIAAELLRTGVNFKREYRLGKRNRVDFMIEGGIIIEVKKGYQYSPFILRQLERYAGFSEVNSLIVVVETKLAVPKVINGKPCYVIALNKLWGIAL